MELELGKSLRRKREELGISQEYLAQLLYRDQTSISKMEKGLRQISVIDFLHWCKALDLSLSDVVELLRLGPYKDE